MNVEQIYTGCLAQAAYYIESNGEAAIIDPLREVQPYLAKAENNGASIKYIFETHFHADFVSGHLDLQKKTGASIVFGPTANPSYEAIIAEDEQVFKIGDYKIKVIHTPGHTLESTTYLLIDENNHNFGIITGDTLFIGDVGRPDLAQKNETGLTREKLAGMLYDSLRTKIMPLEDHVIVFPSHGAGSSCGKNMSKETTDTLGHQKKVNYALRADMTKEEFIGEVLDGLMPPPRYFPQNVMMNMKGYDSLDSIMKKAINPLNPIEFEVLADQADAIVLDVRPQADYIKEHIPNSIFIGLGGSFAPWVGDIIVNTKQALLLVTPEGKEEETITRLSRVGFDNTLGYLKGGFKAWKTEGKECDSLTSISAEALEKVIKEDKDTPIFDVRKPGEFKGEHIENAQPTPLSTINNHLTEFSSEKTNYIHCAGGYRSVIAISLLKRRGIHNLIDIAGGYEAIEKTNINRTDFVCPSTL